MENEEKDLNEDIAEEYDYIIEELKEKKKKDDNK